MLATHRRGLPAVRLSLSKPQRNWPRKQRGRPGEAASRSHSVRSWTVTGPALCRHHHGRRHRHRCARRRRRRRSAYRRHRLSARHRPRPTACRHGRYRPSAGCRPPRTARPTARHPVSPAHYAPRDGCRAFRDAPRAGRRDERHREPHVDPNAASRANRNRHPSRNHAARNSRTNTSRARASRQNTSNSADLSRSTGRPSVDRACRLPPGSHHPTVPGPRARGQLRESRQPETQRPRNAVSARSLLSLPFCRILFFAPVE